MSIPPPPTNKVILMPDFGKEEARYFPLLCQSFNLHVDQLLSTQYLLTPSLQRLHVQSKISGHIVEGQGQTA